MREQEVMSPITNIYCDESGHLPNDGNPVMVLGALCCPNDKTREIARRLREIKAAHGFAPGAEVKWAKVSYGNVALYRALVDYFLDDDDLRFRALVVSDKSRLRHDRFRQDHDTWYYKMYFDLLKLLITPHAQYRIYLDIKDTRSAQKIAKLHEVLCSNAYDFSRRVIARVQSVESRHVEQLQLADLLIGAVSYANRNLSTNAGKVALVARLREKTRYTLTRSTLLREEKFNVFIWRPREVDGD